MHPTEAQRAFGAAEAIRHISELVAIIRTYSQMQHLEISILTREPYAMGVLVDLVVLRLTRK